MAYQDKEEGQEEVVDELQQQALEKSVTEVDNIFAYMRTIHWISSFNQGNSLMLSASGGVQVPEKVLRQVCGGFSEDGKGVFFLQLQQAEYEILSQLVLRVCWMEKDGFCVLFNACKFGNHLLPPIKLSFRVYSDALYKKISKCSEFTLAELTPSTKNPNKFFISQVLNPTVDLLSKPPSGNSNRSSSKGFVAAFGG